MKNAMEIGNAIKARRLSLNRRMDDVAKESGITRSTLWSIEKGVGNTSLASLLRVMEALGLSLDVTSSGSFSEGRKRASRRNALFDKKKNRFLVMCVQQYAASSGRASSSIYEEMRQKGIVEDLLNDYEDLHGMSTQYLNDYIDTLLTSSGSDNSEKRGCPSEHVLAKAILISKVIELIAQKEKNSLDEARDRLYQSGIVDLIEDDETGLYGQSPLYILSLYENK